MAYFECLVGGGGKGNTLVVTCADDLAGATITCTNGTKTYRKTCPSTSPYEVTFYGLEAGTWTVSATVSGNTYTTTVVVADIEALLGGFNWRTWVDTAQFLDSSDYDSLSEVLADELAVRELCLEHACVDYLADIATANEDVETIINNDLFAKWVNNSDYSLDILGANVAIKALMDTADKYFYGEWTLQPQVPTMTSNTAPYGEVIASGAYSTDFAGWKAFDNNDSTYWNSNVTANGYLGYHFISSVRISKVVFYANKSRVHGYKVEGSNTGNTNDWTTIYTGENTENVNEMTNFEVKLNGSTSFLYYRLLVVDSHTTGSITVNTLQFYAWAPKGNVPVMTSNTAPYGTIIEQSQSSGWNNHAYKMFDGNPSTYASIGGNTTTLWAGYKFVNPVAVKRASGLAYPNVQYKIIYSDDGSTWTDACDYVLSDSNGFFEMDNLNVGYHLYYGILRYSSAGVSGLAKELQFYGRELRVSVPTMTGNTTPFGEAFASSYNSSVEPFKAFDNSDSTSWGSATSNNEWVAYDFTKSIVPRQIRCKQHSQARSSKFAIYGSNVKPTTSNYADWTKLTSDISIGTSEVIENISYSTSFRYLIWREEQHTSSYTGTLLMSLQFYGLDYSEKEFEEGTNKKWLYDHGVELEELTTTGFTDGDYTFTNPVFNEDHIQFDATGSAAEQVAGVNMDLSPYSLVRASRATNDNLMNSGNSTYGSLLVATGTNIGTTYTATSAIKGPQMTSNSLSLDVSSINQTVWLLIQTWANMRLSINEFWLE